MSHGNLRYVVLGLVGAREDGVHGYHLKRELEAVCGDFWQVNYGSVYRILDLLDKENAVEVFSDVVGRRPSRKVYRITEKGRQTLDDWLVAPLAENPKPLRDELAMRLLFLSRGNVDAVCEQLKQQRSLYIGKLSRITRWRKTLERTGIDAEVVRLVMDAAEMRVRADLSWLDHVARWIVRTC